MLEFQVVHPGAPVSKARPRVVRGRTYTPAKVLAAEEALGWALKLALPKTHQNEADTCYSVEARFFMPNFKGNDVDNLLKLVLDAANGVVWKDDVQVVEVHGYVVRQDPEPRTEIAIREVPSPHFCRKRTRAAKH